MLLGTVQGDIHDIGKNILSIMLSCYGFTVRDLGVDVPPVDFVAAAGEIRPDIIGLSGLLTVSYDSMRETVRLVRAADEPSLVATPVIIGGGLLNPQVCSYVGADFWTTDAMAGIRHCQALMARHHAD